MTLKNVSKKFQFIGLIIGDGSNLRDINGKTSTLPKKKGKQVHITSILLYEGHALKFLTQIIKESQQFQLIVGLIIGEGSNF